MSGITREYGEGQPTKTYDSTTGRVFVRILGVYPSDGSVPLEAVQPSGGRLLEERFLEILGGQTEGDVHKRPVLGLRCSAIEAAPVDLGVQRGGFPLVGLCHRREPTLCKQPLHDQTEGIH